MLTLWALAITLAVQAETIHLLAPTSLLEKLPIEGPLLLLGQSSLPHRQFLRHPPPPKDSRPTRHPAGTPPVAKSFMSSSKLDDYLNTTLPPEIEKMLTCTEMNLAGLLGTVLDTVSNLDLLSLLDVTSSLDILGDGGLSGVLGLNGVLGKGSSSKSSNLPLPLLSKATGAVGNLIPLAQGALGSLLPNSADTDPAKKANHPAPLSGVLDKAGELTESITGVVNSVVPGGVKDVLSGLLGNIQVKDLLIGLEVQKVTVEDMTSTMTEDGILVQAATTISIGGKSLLGPVISLLGFQVKGDVTLKIGISTNDAQCINLQVQDKDIRIKKVYLQLVKMVTDSLPLPLPLDDIISNLLTVDIRENMKESRSCDIDLSDFTECKNCEYKQSTSLGPPQSVLGGGQAPLGVHGVTGKRERGCELQH